MDNWHTFFDGWTVFKTVKIQERFIKKILEYTDSDSELLEIAAGSGLTSHILSYSDRKVVASDLDYALVEAMNDFGIHAIETNMFDIIGTSSIIFNKREDGKYFDCVFHQGALEHFSDADIVRALKEQGNVAKYVIFDIPNARRLDKTKEFGNERFMYVRKWKELIKKAGLELVEYDGRRLNKVFKYLPFDLENNDFINKYFGTSSIFVCRKLSDEEKELTDF